MLRRILLVVVLALLAWLAWEWIRFPNVAKLADERPKTTAFMEQRKRLLKTTEPRRKAGTARTPRLKRQPEAAYRTAPVRQATAAGR